MEKDDAEPWLEKRFDRWEINAATGNEYVVCTGANVKIEVHKIYGPIAASDCRIFLQYDDASPGEWVVEYMNPATERWEEKARWSCQENWP